MALVVVGEPPVELTTWLGRRRVLGQDRFDEVWEGAYHVVPAPAPSHGSLDRQLAVLLAKPARRAGLVGTTAFNLGEPTDYRVPDGGYHRRIGPGAFLPTCLIVVEVVSPADETYAKFPFYAAHGVAELVIVEPDARRVRIWRLLGAGYVEGERSDLLGVSASELSQGLDWP